MNEFQMLPTWLDVDAAALSGAVAPAQTLSGALPGYTQAQSLTPMQRLQRMQSSGLAECGGAGEPIYLAWRQFLRGHGASVLVIDATGLDVRARGSAAVLDGAPWLLAEGVLIAAGLRDSRTVELRLPAELTGHEAAFLNAVDAVRSLAQISTPRMPAQLLGGGTADRRLSSDPHARDLVPDRAAVRR
jgi:NADH:ubiquinone oxidoreductase subunit F (NADH-binding)